MARRCLRRITRGARGDRKALGWQSLAALPRPLSAAAPLPCGAALGNSFRPTAYRSRRTKTQSTKQDQNQIHPASRSPLEETLEADISTWQKTGHFYFALSELFTHGASLEAFKGLLGALRFQCCVPRLLGAVNRCL